MRTRRTQSSGSPVPSVAGLQDKTLDSAQSMHRSVLLHESLDLLALKEDDVVLDATLGGAGHAHTFAQALGKNGVLIGFDLDTEAVKRAQEKLLASVPATHLIQANFRDIVAELHDRGISSITKALFDLGWSSYQLDSGRGFSFQADEPLDMRYGANMPLTAATIVNTWSEKTLADIIFAWGEERYARRIAKALVQTRSKRPFTNSRELAEVIRSAVPPTYRHGRIHPATRTFQALRIAVNDELGALEEGLRGAWRLLAPRGRIAVISFHSIEDRIVKRFFAEWEKEGVGTRITKKPVVASSEELAENPRARSAKLRVLEKNFHESTDTKDKQIRPFDISGEV